MKFGNSTQVLLLIVTLLVAANFWLDQSRRQRIETLEMDLARAQVTQLANGLFQSETVRHFGFIYRAVQGHDVVIGELVKRVPIENLDELLNGPVDNGRTGDDNQKIELELIPVQPVE